MKKAIIHGDIYLENSVIQDGVVLIEDKKSSLWVITQFWSEAKIS